MTSEGCVRGLVRPVRQVRPVRPGDCERAFAIGIGRAAPEWVARLGAFARGAEYHWLAAQWAGKAAWFVRPVSRVRLSPLTARRVKPLCEASALQKSLALAFELALQQIRGLIYGAKHRVAH